MFNNLEINDEYTVITGLISKELEQLTIDDMDEYVNSSDFWTQKVAEIFLNQYYRTEYPYSTFLVKAIYRKYSDLFIQFFEFTFNNHNPARYEINQNAVTYSHKLFTMLFLPWFREFGGE